MIPKGDINTIWKVSIGHKQHVGYNNRTFPIHPNTSRYLDGYLPIPPVTPMGTSRYLPIHRRVHPDTLFPDDSIYINLDFAEFLKGNSNRELGTLQNM